MRTDLKMLLIPEGQGGIDYESKDYKKKLK